MSGPLWIVAAALLFWGWEVGALPVATLMAAACVTPVFTRRRFALGLPEFHRALDVCWVLGFGGLLLIYSRESVGNVFRTFGEWLPVAVFPAFLAQIGSTTGRVPVSALVPMPRWRKRSGQHSNPWLDLRPAFLTVCILSTSIAGAARPWFYPGILVLLGTALWIHRSRSARLGPAIGLFAIAALGGWGISRGLAEMQPWIENRVLEWTSQFDRDGSPNRISKTSIGHRGRVGGTSRIVLQVRNEGPAEMPNLLKVATFSAWRDGAWYAAQGGFEKIEAGAEEWVLEDGPVPTGAIHMEWARARTSDLLPLPNGTRILREFPADKVERSALGVVRAEARPGVVGLRVEFGESSAAELGPSDEDRNGIPPLEWKSIQAVAEELGLRGHPPAEAIARIERFFFTRFEYTLDLEDRHAEGVEAATPLARFLLVHRRGHCEYFATAATLLLRAAGIPARYSTGFLVSPTEQANRYLLVRESQAHAWVRVWVNGAWQDFDPTPPAGFDAPAQGTGWWERLGRRWNESTFSLIRWWWLGEKRLLRQAYWLALPLLAGLLWRFRSLRAAGGGRGPSRSGSLQSWPGSDSEWYTVERELSTRGWSRRLHEALDNWRDRLESDGWAAQDTDRIRSAVLLHHRLRFDPEGLPPGERERLRALARELTDHVMRSFRAQGRS